MKENNVIVKKVSEFTFGHNCVYRFQEPLVLNAIALRDQPGFIVVNIYFDEFYIGVGKSVDSAIYDWETKFHGYYQRFERLGYLTPREEEIYNIMSSLLDVDYYKENQHYAKVVTGEIVSCREYDGLFPSSYKLTGSEELKPFPEYTRTDANLMTLEKGDKFKGVFEYKLSDGSLHSVLYIERLSNDKENT